MKVSLCVLSLALVASLALVQTSAACPEVAEALARFRVGLLLRMFPRIAEDIRNGSFGQNNNNNNNGLNRNNGQNQFGQNGQSGQNGQNVPFGQDRNQNQNPLNNQNQNPLNNQNQNPLNNNQGGQFPNGQMNGQQNGQQNGGGQAAPITTV